MRPPGGNPIKVLVIQKVFSHELRQPQVVQSMFGSTEPHFASVPATFGAFATRGRVKKLFNIKYFHGRSRPCPHQWRPRSGNGKVSGLRFRHDGSPWIPSSNEAQSYGHGACHTTLYTAIILMVKDTAYTPRPGYSHAPHVEQQRTPKRTGLTYPFCSHIAADQGICREFDGKRYILECPRRKEQPMKA